MRFHLENPEQYLQHTAKQARKRELPNTDETDGIERKLTRRFTDLSWGQEGEMGFIIKEGDGYDPGVRFTINYDSKITELFQQYLDYLDGRMKDYEEFHRSEDYQLPLPLSDYRHINNLRLESEGKQFDLRQIVGDDVDIYVYTGDKARDYTQESRAFFVKPENDKKITFLLSAMDPTSLFGLSVFLHEVGHIERNKVLTEKEEASYENARVEFSSGEKPLNPKDGAIIINNERFADAFMINTLRHFFPHSDDLGNIARLAHTDRMGYHTAISRRIKGKPIFDPMIDI